MVFSTIDQGLKQRQAHNYDNDRNFVDERELQTVGDDRSDGKNRKVVIVSAAACTCLCGDRVQNFQFPLSLPWPTGVWNFIGLASTP